MYIPWPSWRPVIATSQAPTRKGAFTDSRHTFLFTIMEQIRW
uniref:Uncharacterized protein n=1 Tax=Rhizophora mucronata TaxID=61149 RepID=A0A2P2NGH9_RHIMU